MEQKNDFLIIDGDSFIHRAYHGYKKHNQKYSNDTNYAIKGFSSMITRALKDNQFYFLAIVLDHQGKNFRHRLSDKYKANRPEKEESFKNQIIDIHSYIKDLGLPYFCVKDVEGDDVIATLARKAQLKKWKTKILTGDKDIAQVIDENTILHDTRFDKIISINNLEEIFGVKNPNQIIDFLAMQGDKADNIDGISGCGKGTAQKMLSKYGSLDKMMNLSYNDLISDVEKMARNKKKAEEIVYQIINNKENIILAQKLVKLQDDLEMPLSQKDIKFKADRINKESIHYLLEKYQLSKTHSIPDFITTFI